MKSDRKRIHCILFLVSGVLVFTGCSNKQDKKSKQLKTEIIAENTQNTDREEDLYFDQKVTAEQICDINLNQVGYRPKDKKITVVRDTLYTELGRVAISPFGTVKYQKELMRSQARITEEEYDALVEYAIDLGVENGFIQEGETAKESFIPAFDYEGV